MSAHPRLPQDAEEALARGETIEAIRRVRAATGLGLKEAKDLVDAFVHGRGQSHAAGASGHGDGKGAEFIVPAAAATALQQGNVIEAIKLIREANRLGLKEAKDAVAQLRSHSVPGTTLRAYPRRTPTVSEGDRGLGGWMFLLAAVIAAFAWWLLAP